MLRRHSLAVTAIVLFCFALGCTEHPTVESVTAEKDKLASELAKTKAQLNEALKAQQADRAALDSVRQENSVLRDRVAKFGVAFPGEAIDTFDHGITSLAEGVIRELTDGTVDGQPKSVSVGSITLGGLARNIPKGDQPVVEHVGQTVEPDSLDRLGPWIEKFLEQSLAEHKAIRVVDRSRAGQFIIRGSYVPDSPTTIKILLRLYRAKGQETQIAITRTISTTGINKPFLHFINQFDERSAK